MICFEFWFVWLLICLVVCLGCLLLEFLGGYLCLCDLVLFLDLLVMGETDGPLQLCVDNDVFGWFVVNCLFCFALVLFVLCYEVAV